MFIAFTGHRFSLSRSDMSVCDQWHPNGALITRGSLL